MNLLLTAKSKDINKEKVATEIASFIYKIKLENFEKILQKRLKPNLV